MFCFVLFFLVVFLFVCFLCFCFCFFACLLLLVIFFWAYCVTTSAQSTFLISTFSRLRAVEFICVISKASLPILLRVSMGRLNSSWLVVIVARDVSRSKTFHRFSFVFGAGCITQRFL